MCVRVPACRGREGIGPPNSMPGRKSMASGPSNYTCHAAEATSHSDGSCGRQLTWKRNTHTHRHTTLIRNRSKPLQPGPLQQQGPLQPGPRQPGARFKHGYGCRVTTCETSRGRCSRKHTHPEPLLPGPLQPGPLQSGKRFEHGCACRMTACETSRGHCGRGFQSLVWVATKLEI
jgi:hypothetical protein